MGKAALVEQDIEEGKRLVDKLVKDSGEKIPIALWLYNSSYGGWRLVLAVPQMVRGPQAAYHFIGNVLKELREQTDQLFRLTLQDISLISPKDPLVKTLLREKQSASALRGRILDSLRIGDRFLEGVYLYKVA
ncbi:MAG: hypothetical protein ACREDR_19780 [Blastocatellia bacterium]